MLRVLLIEDDEKLGQQVVEHLRSGGYAPTWVRDGDRALALDPSPYALIVLDLMLPGAYGLDVLKAYRRHADVPVLVLSARHDTVDKVRSLELGADDYVTKPFWPEELIARIHARLRRPVLQREGRIEIGPIAIDIEGRTVDAGGRRIDLTRAEFELLLALARRPGSAVPRSWLVDHVLDPEKDGTERTLDVHVSRLRKKLGSAAGCVATVWGVGYRLEAEPTT